jgi:hypothetical protein
VEWIVFAGFALFIWWRLVKDDYQRSLEEHEDSDSEGPAPGHADPEHPKPDETHPEQTHPEQTQQKV